MTTQIISVSSAATAKAAFTPEEIAMKRDREEWDNEGGAVRIRKSNGSSPSASPAQDAAGRGSPRDEHRK
jgi:hypothetical protein